ncbi:hypothetical protein [Crenothrix polyspora]|uniref:Uncharacterized protein n=1 Tax=Crenothrix polyspora TaxID=360316 RepID=A0A1R4H3A7_9GAMM|nr:hypothetical protein [Crenothrix polyspora]SJM90709.1 exported hypothetical protein [Crenothrix polyspora]
MIFKKQKPFLIAVTIIQLMGFSTLAMSKALPNNCGNVTVRTCPAGSISTTTGLPGVTNDNQCKKLAGEININASVPNGSSIGTWGVVSDNKIWQYVAAIVTIEKGCLDPNI